MTPYPPPYPGREPWRTPPEINTPPSDVVGLPPLILIVFIAFVLLWTEKVFKKSDPPKKSPEEELFEAIGKYETKKDREKKWSEFKYKVEDKGKSEDKDQPEQKVEEK